MPIERASGSNLKYYLIAFDADGQENQKDPHGTDGLLSRRLLEEVRRKPITDIFLMSHGWKGDVPAAKEQYQNWVAAAAQCQTDLDRLSKQYPHFRPLIVGLHWPSLPWGDEELVKGNVDSNTLVDRFADRLGISKSARSALQTIVQVADQNPSAVEFPTEVQEAYRQLAGEAYNSGTGAGALPGPEEETFDAQAFCELVQEEPSEFGMVDPFGWLLSPLCQLSFWRMKARGRRFGESGAHALLNALQAAGPNVRLHLMGHSFGCIVMSAAVAGPPGGSGLLRPVQSLVLVQGAMSLWAYCSSIPSRPTRPGYFWPVIKGERVAGPIVTTQSCYDRAVRKWYPLGVRAAQQVDYGPGLPLYGAVGTFGLRGDGLDLVKGEMVPTNTSYDFEAGRIYNLKSDAWIRTGDGASGAHSDIAHPEVAHVVWEAALPERLTFNGINAANGAYLSPPCSPREVIGLAIGHPLPADDLDDLSARHWLDTHAPLAPIERVKDPSDLAQAGWGVIFPHGSDPAIKEALNELLEHRKAQASRNKTHYYKEYSNDKAYRPHETKRAFLYRHGAQAGMPADPDKVPYYLLLVADPRTISWSFQSQLDVEYAVGRLWFEKETGEPDLDAFRSYAATVVAAEKGEIRLPRRAVFFGVENADDRPTRISATRLIQPLVEDLAKEHKEWSFPCYLKEKETRKTDLTALLKQDPPALLFTASHGMGFPADDPWQLSDQGALLCRDWPGPVQWAGAKIPRDHYLRADDLDKNAQFTGLVAFHFACYGAGTPQFDDYAHLDNQEKRPAIAARTFVARLPQRLLGHPNRGALAVVGHVERAWSCSFYGGPRLGSQLQAFQSTMDRLLKGSRLGFAMEYMNQLHAALAVDLNQDLENIKYGAPYDPMVLSAAWTAQNDARSYLVLGDPAVRLAVATPPAPSH